MNKLEQLYAFIDKQKLSGEITPAQEEIYKKVEELLIMEDATSRIAKAVAPELSNIRRSVSFIVDYNPGGKIQVRPVLEGTIIEGNATVVSPQVEVDDETEPVPFHEDTFETLGISKDSLVYDGEDEPGEPLPGAEPIVISRNNIKDSESHDLRITIDGKVFEEKNSIQTFIKALQYIGLDNVAKVGIICCGYNLVDSRKRTDGNRKWQQQVDGKWIYVYFSNPTKCKYLFDIADYYHFNIRIEAID